MHLEDIQFSNIIPVSISLVEQRLSQNFKIIFEALKTQEALRSKHETLAADNYHLKETVLALTARLDGIEGGLKDTIARQTENMSQQGNSIRIEFQTMKPFLEKMRWNTERVDGIEKQFKLIQGTVREFDLIRKELSGMEGRNQLIIENYRDENARKTVRLGEQTSAVQDQLLKTAGQLSILKRKVESIDLSVLLAPKNKSSSIPEHPPIDTTRTSPSIDDIFKQKVLQKINNINVQLGDFAFEKQTSDLRHQLREQKKVLDNKMDMDQYERMLDFMSEEIKRTIRGESVETNDKQVVGSPVRNREERAPVVSNPATIQTTEHIPTEYMTNMELSNSAEESREGPRELHKDSQGERKLPLNSQSNPNITGSSDSQLILEGLQTDRLKQDSPNKKLRLVTKSSNKGQVEQIKLLQGLNARIHLLQGELEALRQQNIDVLRILQQLKLNETSVALTDRYQQQHTNSKPHSKQPSSRRDSKQVQVLPAIGKQKDNRRYKDTNQSMQMYQGVTKRRPSRSNLLSDSKLHISEEASEPRIQQLQKKMSDLRNQVHYYFKQLEKNINTRETKDDLKKRIVQVNDKIEEIRQLAGKKMDAEAVRKSLLFLENKVNQVIAIMISNEGEAEATMARRGWACLSCDKNMQKFDGKQGDHKSWNHMQGRQSPPRASGFVSLQRNQQRYRNLYMNREEQAQK